MNHRHLKRITAISLALLMAGTMSGAYGINREATDFAISANAAGNIYQGTCGENLNWTLNLSDGFLTITGSGKKMKDYTYRTAPWSKYASNISTIVLPKNLESIGSHAFVELENLHTIYTSGNTARMPVFLSSIGDFAFSGCTNLMGTSGSSLLFKSQSNGVLSIGYRAFEDCKQIRTVSFNGYKEIEIRNYAFRRMNDLQTADFGGAATAIGKHAFKDCTKLSNVQITLSAKSVHKDAFLNTPYDSNGCVASTNKGAVNYGAASTMAGKIRVVNIFVDQAIKNSDGTYRLSGNWGERNTTSDHNGLVYKTTKSDPNCVKSLNDFNYTAANDTNHISQSAIDNGTANFKNQPVTSAKIAKRLESVRIAMNQLQDQAYLYGESFTWDMNPATNFYVTLYMPDQPNMSIENNILTNGNNNPLNGRNSTAGSLCDYLKTVTSGDVDLCRLHGPVASPYSPFTNKLKTELGYDSVVYLVHNLKSGGRSCTFPDNRRYSKYVDEWALILVSNENTIAHETCHLFGAKDYYPEQTESAGLDQYFIHAFDGHPEIMEGFGSVSPLTAFSIGWRNNLDKTIYDKVSSYIYS